MNTGFEPNDELRRIWQTPGRPKSENEVYEIMELVETRARKFERTILWRNIREYVAAGAVAVGFAVLASTAGAPLLRIGYATVSATGLWVILFMRLMQRSAPLPEVSGEDYGKALLRQYDRQILLNRTAWAWYALPFTVGLVLVSLGHDHPAGFGRVMAAFMLAMGVVIAVLNRKVAKTLTAEKRELQQLLEAADAE